MRVVVIVENLQCYQIARYYRAWNVQRICIWATDSFAKSGKSTVSFTFLGKIYRFFDEIRREKVKAIMLDSWAWNAHLVWVKVLRHGALFRQNVQTWRENQAPRRAPMKSIFEFKVRLKCAKNLYLSHRFFCKIRQIHRFFNVFRLEFSKQGSCPEKWCKQAFQVFKRSAVIS